MFHWRRVHVIALALVVAAIGLTGGRAHAAEKSAVSMTLQSISVTNMAVQFSASPGNVRVATQLFYYVVFQVTNSGSKPVHVTSCGSSMTPTNFFEPFGMSGHCQVPPYTNALLGFAWRPYLPGPYWFRYAVSEPASLVEKGEFAAGRFKANLSGKASYTQFWFSDLWSPAYEITSPVIAQMPEMPRASDSLRPISTKSPAESVLGYDWSTNGIKSSVEIPTEDELQFQMEMERLRRMLEDKRHYDQSRDRGSLLSQRAAHPAALRYRNSVAKFEKDAEDQDPEVVAEELDAACAWPAHFRSRDV